MIKTVKSKCYETKLYEKENPLDQYFLKCTAYTRYLGELLKTY